MKADYIKWMDYSRRWVRHDLNEGGIENTDLYLGKGYEVRFRFATSYTFCGLPAAMIQYDDASFGFDANPVTGDASGLSSSVEYNGTVTLTWIKAVNITPEDRYFVFRSEMRDGFWGVQDQDYELIANLSSDTLTVKDFEIARANTEYYYIIVPVNTSTGKKGTSTYSIGIWTANLYSKYDTFGLPLKLSDVHTVDWYSDSIPYTVGINYYINPERRWGWHSVRMPKGVYDPVLMMAEGYQISTSSSTRYSFIGI